MTSSMGLSGSDTKACKVRVSSGKRNPAIRARRGVEPATASPSRSVRMRPRLVCTACTCPCASSMPVTSQFSIRSTPAALATRANQAHGVQPPARIAQLGPSLDDFDLAALADHQIEIKPGTEVLPKSQVFILKTYPRLAQVIGPNHRGIAPGVAAAEPVALEHGHPTQPLIAHQMPGRGQAMSAAAYHHRLVAALRLRRTPGPWPTPMASKSLFEKLEEAVTHDG